MAYELLEEEIEPSPQYQIEEELEPEKTSRRSWKDWALGKLMQAGAGAAQSFGSFGNVAGLLQILNPYLFGKDSSFSPENQPELPPGTKIPTSSDIRSWLKGVGVPEEEDWLDKLLRGGAENVGGGALLGGSGNLSKLLLSGLGSQAAGQIAESQGASPGLRTAVELATGLGLSRSKVPLQSKNAQVQKTLEKMKSMGYGEDSQAIVKNALEKRSLVKSRPSYGAKAEQAFENLSTENAALFDKLKSERFGKYLPETRDQTLKSIRENVGKEYENLKKIGDFPISVNDFLVKSMSKATNRLEGYVAPPEVDKVIKWLNKSAEKMKTSGMTGAEAINWYQQLNRTLKDVKGITVEQKELTKLKKHLTDSMRKQGKQGVDLAQKFEDINKQNFKLHRLEDSEKILERAKNSDGVFSGQRLKNMLSNEENLTVLRETLGKNGVANLRAIEKVYENGEALKRVMQRGKSKTATPLVMGMYHLLAHADPSHLGRYMAGIGSYATAAAISERMLVDPKFQNLSDKLIKAVKSKSTQDTDLILNQMADLLGVNEKQPKDQESTESERYQLLPE